MFWLLCVAFYEYMANVEKLKCTFYAFYTVFPLNVIV